MDGMKQSMQFIPLNRSNVDELSELAVRESEQHLICSNPEWLAQAAFVAESLTFGIFKEGRPVGVISFIDPRLVDEDDEDHDHYQENCLYVWRVMVDKGSRGANVGVQAIEFALGYARLVGLQGVSLTTMDREAGNALPFYERLGFSATGRRLDDEAELVFRFG